MLRVLQRLEEADARSAGKETSFSGADSRSHRFLGPCAHVLAQTQWAGGGGRTRGLEAGGLFLHGQRVAGPARGRTHVLHVPPVFAPRPARLCSKRPLGAQTPSLKGKARARGDSPADCFGLAPWRLRRAVPWSLVGRRHQGGEELVFPSSAFLRSEGRPELELGDSARRLAALREARRARL